MGRNVDEEIDMLHWRIDQLQQMVRDLAFRVGQDDMAMDMIRFHNQDVIPAIEKMRKATD